MLKYAQKKTEQQKRKLKMKRATKYMLPNEMSLPSAETIRNENPDETAIRQNMELMEYNDKYSDSEDEDETQKKENRETISVSI